jgi:hypothetical protein
MELKEKIEGIIHAWGWQQAMSTEEAANKIIALFENKLDIEHRRLAIETEKLRRRLQAAESIVEACQEWEYYQKLLTLPDHEKKE